MIHPLKDSSGKLAAYEISLTVANEMVLITCLRIRHGAAVVVRPWLMHALFTDDHLPPVPECGGSDIGVCPALTISHVPSQEAKRTRFKNRISNCLIINTFSLSL